MVPMSDSYRNKWRKSTSLGENVLGKLEDGELKKLYVTRLNSFDADYYSKEYGLGDTGLRDAQKIATRVNDELWADSQKIAEAVAEIRTVLEQDGAVESLQAVHDMLDRLSGFLKSVDNWREKNEEAFQTFGQLRERPENRQRMDLKQDLEKSMRECVYNEGKIIQVLRALEEEEELWMEDLQRLKQQKAGTEIAQRIEELQEEIESVVTAEETEKSRIGMPLSGEDIQSVVSRIEAD